MMSTNGESKAAGKNEKHHDSGNESKVNVVASENDNPQADVDPGRTPGKAEGVDDPEKEGNQ